MFEYCTPFLDPIDLSYEDYADELPEYSDPDIPLVQDDHQCVNPHIPLEEQP